MNVTYSSRDYAPDHVRKRYVKHDDGDRFRWCEVGDDRRYDLRQGSVDADELPPEIAAAARAAAGICPRYVDWPL